MKKWKRSMKKFTAAFLAFAMALTPCITGFSTVLAADEGDMKYQVTLSDAEHGKLEFKDGKESVQKFKEKDKVELTVSPDKGYILQKLTIQAEGTDEKVEDTTSGDSYTFTMPAADLVVSAEFKPAETDVKGELLGDDEVYYFTEDTDYSKISRKDYEDIDWKKYGDNGIYKEDTKEFLKSAGIEVGKEENYGLTLENYYANKPQTLSTADGWDVGTVLYGSCNIEYAYIAGSQSYFGLSNFTGNLAGAEMIGEGWCADHTAAEPEAGHPVVSANATITSIDPVAGYVYALLSVTPEGVTTGHVGENGLLTGYQHIAANIRIPKEFDGSLSLTKSSANTVMTSGNSCYSLEGAQYGVYRDAACTDLAATLTTDANGNTNTVNIAAGSYWVKETVAPKGYYKDNRVYPVTVSTNQHAVVNVVDEPMNDPAAIEIKKIDQDTGDLSFQGSASLEGAQFTIKHYGGLYSKEEIEAGKPQQDGVNVRTWVLETKEITYPDGSVHYLTGLKPEYKVSGDDFYYTNGNVNPALPLGTISVEETKAPNGYLLEDAWLQAEGSTEKIEGMYVAQIRNDNDGAFLDGGNEFSVSDKVVRGGVKIQKYDAETSTTIPQGDATLQNAAFDIINLNDNAVKVEGEFYQKNEVVKTLVTNANGYAESAADLLPYGIYKIVEKTAPEGYLNKGTIERAFSIVEDGVIVDLTSPEHGILNDIIRGGVKVQKRDIQSSDTTPQGNASLGKAEFDIINMSKNAVRVEGKMYQNGEVVKHLVADGNGYAETANDLLPFGTYKVVETKAPNGYLQEGVLERTFKIEKDGKIVDLTDKDDAILNRVIRGDFELIKADEETQERMAYIPFQITSNTTGESHKFMTDENGYYSSESKFNKHSHDTNGGKADSGLWFGLKADGTNVKVDDDLGALPIDTYTIEELKCKANEDKVLYRGTLNVTRDGFTLDLGTIDNPDLTLTTKAIDEETGTHYSCADDEVTIVDTLSFTGLKKGKEYEATGTLMNQETGKALLDEEGNLITASRTFKPATAEGETEVTFTFDASNLQGADIVVFEEVRLDGKLVVEHKDINDKDQTIHFPDLGTKASDKETETNVSKADKEITIVDTVSYKNLQSGKKYTVKGTLMDKETGEPVPDAKGYKITAETEFKAEKSSGTVEVAFKFDGSNLAGETIVVFENLYRGEKLLAVHADLEDKAQTVTIPKVTTTAVDAESKTQNSMADEKVVIEDTVSYENLIPGQEYTVKGTLMDVATEKPVVAKTATMVDAEFEIPEGAAEVSFEKGTYVYVATGNEDVPAGLYQKTEEGFILSNAREALKEIPDELITWSETFKDAATGYIKDGKLTLKPEAKPDYSEKEEEVTAETTFTAEAEKGKTEVTFIFDGSKYAGHTFVVFEELFMNEKSVAEHKDLKDAGQTIYVPEIKTTAKDAETETQNSLADKEVTIVDTVSCKNLIPGKEYKVSGKLYDKETKEPLKVNDKVVVAETTFNPEKPDGSVEVTFKFDGSALQGKTIVVFENLYINGKEVAVHADIEDKDQSIYFPELKTTATDKDDNDKKAYADNKVTIVDEVSYSNLVPSETYTVVGTLMDKSTGKALVINEKEVQATKTFIAEKGAGKVSVDFTFDGNKLGGKDVVVFEKLYDVNGVEVGNHEDINDEGQTVKLVTPLRTTVKTGDAPWMYVMAIVGGALIGAGVYFVGKKTKK